MVCIDANVALRYLLADDPTLYARARAVLESDTGVYMPYEVLAEIVYVLTKIYGVERKKTADTLLSLITGRKIQYDRTGTALYALRVYRDSSMDIVDSLLCARSVQEGTKIESFDKKVNSYISRHLPAQT